MNEAATFSDAELRAIRRTFYTRKATPEEVYLVVRPTRRSWHMARMPIALIVVLAINVVLNLRGKVFSSGLPEFEDILVPEFWGTCCAITLLVLLVFYLLPGAYPPRFELVLRPGGGDVTMRGFGFAQTRPASCCCIANRHLWCSFYVDTIRYAMLRRWWQLLLPPGQGAAAVAGVLAPAQAALRALLASGGGQSEMFLSASRTLWAKAFGEALVTENEVVLILPPAGWSLWIGAVIGGALGGTGVLLWQGWHSLIWGYYTPDMQVVKGLSSIPMWLPSALVILYTGFVCMWADPWFRRAVAVVPKGQAKIRIQIGRRTIGEFPFWSYSIFVSDGRGHETVSSYLWVRTPAWTGTKGAEPHFEEHVTAVWRLKSWAGVSTEEEDG
jgi:hypothetical protein